MKIKKIKKRPYRGIVVADSWLEHFIRKGGDPAVLFSVKSRHLKSSDSCRSAIVEIGLAGQNDKTKKIYAKEFFYKNFFHSFKPIFRIHRVQISWRNSWNLLQNGVNVPEPAGYLLHQVGPSCRGAYFFAEALTECIDLGRLAWNFEELEKRLVQSELIETLAMMVASLHDSGMVHGDLKWSNIMVHLKENKAWFIDLDAAKIRRIIPGPARIARDLARFVLNGMEIGVDNSIIDRFLDQYAIQRNLIRASIDKSLAPTLSKLWKIHQKKYPK